MRAGSLMAVGAGLAIGAFLIIIDQTSAGSGLVPLLTSRATSTVVTVAVVGILALAAVRRGAPRGSVLHVAGAQLGAAPSGHADLEHATTDPRPTVTTARQAWSLAIACGIADAAANALMLLALRTGDLAVVSALTALYPAGTILLAAIVLRERVAVVQWVGLGLALAAGGMLAVAYGDAPRRCRNESRDASYHAGGRHTVLRGSVEPRDAAGERAGCAVSRARTA